jgi:hypothetical protein
MPLSLDTSGTSAFTGEGWSGWGQEGMATIILSFLTIIFTSVAIGNFELEMDM